MPTELNEIVIQGARQHNLKHITVTIPKRQLTVLTGVSGSGKSSLAFDTLYAEGQRRYIESLSSYARQFLGQMEKPLYDHIRGIAPTISVEQKAASNNPRSTVGTVTEIHDYLRVLFARVGQPFCYQCGRAVTGQSAAQIVRDLEASGEGRKVTVFARVLENRKGEHKELISQLRQDGFSRLRLNGEIVSLKDDVRLDKRRKHTLDVVIDRVTIKPGIMPRLTEAIELALRVGEGSCTATVDEEAERLYSEARACPHCNLSFPELTPQLFSFNSPQGMCHDCNGLGTRFDMDPARIVPDHAKTLADGAVADWGQIGGQKGGWTGAIARAVCKKNKIDIDKPWSKLTQKQREVVLYGTGHAR
ncbi:MAG: excinuclease ABC subunit UvrA, partial [Planctomycetota bacterium]